MIIENRSHSSGRPVRRGSPRGRGGPEPGPASGWRRPGRHLRVRRVKAEAALRGRKFKELVEEALGKLLASPEPGEAEKPGDQPSFHDLMKDCCGIVPDTPADYATNPEYMDGFGR